MPGVIGAFPFPWRLREAQDLHAALCQIYPTAKGALFVAVKAGLDPAFLNGDQPGFLVWKEVLEAAANAGKTGALVQLVVAQNPGNPYRPFFAALLASQPAVVDREARGADGAPVFLKDTDDVTEPEALLFHDDLTLGIGRIPWLIGVLQRLVTLAPAVCRLEVTSSVAVQSGTAFRVGPDLLLTNWHVLFFEGASPTKIVAEFGFDDDGQGGGPASTGVPCDIASVRFDKADDWGIVRVAMPLADAIPVLKLSEAGMPALKAPAFVIQHPAGQRKRVAFVRNQITTVDPRIVHYLSDTQAGSSGAPVLDESGRLIALHRAGGRPQEVAGKSPLKKNEGIRIDRIVAGLAKAGITTL